MLWGVEMNELNVKLVSPKNIGYPLVKIDGESVAFTRNKYNNFVYNFRTDKQRVKIEVYRCIDVGGFFWFISQLFFFLISVFGLFDIHRRERCVALDFAVEVDLQQLSDITLRCKPRKDNESAIEVATNLTVRQISNRYFIDTRAKKKLKILLAAKILLAIASVTTIILAILL